MGVEAKQTHKKKRWEKMLNSQSRYMGLEILVKRGAYIKCLNFLRLNNFDNLNFNKIPVPGFEISDMFPESLPELIVIRLEC